MANKTINDLTAVTTAATGDFVPIWRASNGDTRKITRANFIGATLTGAGTIATGGFTLTIAATSTINGSLVGNISGGGTLATGGFTLTLSGNGGTLALGGFTLTVPATGTASLLGTAQRYSALKTFSAGISLGNETLSTYDEGTFTPQFADNSSGGNVATVTAAVGRYIKIGKHVTVWITLLNIDKTALVGGNLAFIRALPFAASSVSNYAAVGNVLAGSLTVSGAQQVTPWLGAGLSYLNLYQMLTGAEFEVLDVSDIAATTADMYITISYLTDS